MPPSLFGRRSMGQCQKGRLAGAASTGLAITAGSYPGLPSLRENVLSPRWGCELTPLYTPGLRPGLHSVAAPRLKNDGTVPPALRFLSSHTDSSTLGFTITPPRGYPITHKGCFVTEFLCHLDPAVEAPGFSRVTYRGNKKRALAPVAMNHRG